MIKAQYEDFLTKVTVVLFKNKIEYVVLILVLYYLAYTLHTDVYFV